MAKKQKTPPGARDPDQPDTAVAKSAKNDLADRKALFASLAISPAANAAAVVQKYGDPFGTTVGVEADWIALIDSLKHSAAKVQDGNMKECEAMLMAQAQALQSIFMNFSRRALAQDYQKHLESFFGMAMKAQNQCRMTLETLSKMKNPPVVFAKQANIAQGHQQVNVGTAPTAHAEKAEVVQNGLLEEQNGQRLDTGAAGTPIGADSAMATLEPIDGAAQCRG